MNEDSIFLESLQLPAVERAAFLERACCGDAELRASIERLLAAHQAAGDFLGQKAEGLPATVASAVSERIGMQIGPYKLLEQIGEGGFGVVFMAEQHEPVRRRVALKVVKPGMDTQQVIARFEQERQALALMDHPHIAKVLDAGTTSSGRPYFVMELIRGVPITQYCDERQLTPRQRLELFVPVCQAVQHAHQKGIIHRDIKPSNVLVTMHDGHPLVKVIDFGVAKATGQQLTEKTLFTGFAQMIGTPLYMSPEQAELTSQDIDTRTDIYSLGVLLYELLTGTTPFEKQRFQQAAFDEIRRIIREEEPPRPSLRLSSLGDTLPSVSALRNMEPRKLSQLMRGDLDWIVMKALEKDRTRRYETATGLARDVQRFLDDEPVEACPPSAAYRFRKFARRNRGAFLTATGISAALIAGTILSTWLAIRATQAEQLAEKRLIAADQARAASEQATKRAQAAERQAAGDLARALAAEKQTGIERDRAEANFAQARKAVEEYFVQVSENDLLKVPGMEHLRQRLLASALEFFEEFVKLRGNDPSLKLELANTQFRIGLIRQDAGEKEAAGEAFADAARRYQRLLRDDPQNIAAATGHARCLLQSGRNDEAIAAWKALLERSPGNRQYQSELASAHNFAANAKNKAEQRGEALTHHQQARDLRVALLASEPNNPEYLGSLASTLNNIAVILSDTGRREDSLPLYQEAIRYNEQAHRLAPHVIEYARGMAIQYGNIANAQSIMQRTRAAADSYLRSAETWKSLAARHPMVPDFSQNLMRAYRAAAAMLRKLDDTQQAAQVLRQARDVLDRLPRDSADDWYVYAQVKSLNAAPPTTGSIALDVSDEAERKRDADEALVALNTAVEKGFRDVARLRRDPELAAVRDRPDFQSLLAYLDQAELLAKAEAKPAGEQLAAVGDVAQTLEKLSVANPENARLLAALAQSRYALGVARLGLGEVDEAARLLGEARAAQEKLVERYPLSGEYLAALGNSWYALGHVAWKRNQYQQAAEHWDRGQAALVRGAVEAPEAKAVTQALAKCEVELAYHFARYGHWTLAHRHWEASKNEERSQSLVTEARFLVLTARVSTAQQYAEQCRLLFEKFEKENDPNLLWGLVVRRQTGVPAEKLLAVARQIRDANPNSFTNQILALAQLRVGQGAQVRGQLWPSNQAVVEFEQGHVETARALLEAAEKSYADTATRQALSAAATPLSELPRWWDTAYNQTVRRDAWQIVMGRLPPDPWQPLVEAALWQRMGEAAQAEKSFQTCVDADPRNPEVWSLRARLRAMLGDQAGALADWAKAIEVSPQRAETWIARGRWYAERGERGQAEADFVHAASLTTGELDKFVQAGWWIAGQRPGGLESADPPPDRFDPSQPLTLPEQAAGQPAAPWRAIPTGALGQIYLPTYLPEATDHSCYMLTCIGSPDERVVDLVLGASGPRRLWLNGRVIHESTRAERAGSYGILGASRVPLPLVRGSNTLVVKATIVKGQGAIDARLSDSVVDRAVALTEQLQYAEALPLWNQLSSEMSDLFLWRSTAMCAAAAGDEASCRRVYERMVASYANSARTVEPYSAHSLLLSYGMLDQPIADKIEWDRMMAAVQEKKMSFWNYSAGLGEYRAGRHDRALALLLDSNAEANPPIWPLIALALHASGKETDARVWLGKAQTWRDSLAARGYLLNLPWYYTPATIGPYFESLFREAATKISGSIPPRNLTPLTAQGDFIVQSAGKEWKVPTLEIAIGIAREGDRIEIRGNGPFVCQPLTIDKALTIGAGEGFRPVIQLSPQAVQARTTFCINRAPLCLEGLEIQLVAPGKDEREDLWQTMFESRAPLRLANCRLLFKQTPGAVISNLSKVCDLRNCEIITPTFNWVGSYYKPHGVLNVENCCLTTLVAMSYLQFDGTDYTQDATFRMTRNTLLTSHHAVQFDVNAERVPGLWTETQNVKPVTLAAEGNIWSAPGGVLQFVQSPPGKILPAGEAEAALPQVLSWRGARNLYALQRPYLTLGIIPRKYPEPANPILELADWGRYWGAAEAGSIQGQPSFQGGDLLAKLQTAPENLTAEDFRLVKDSPGYRAGPDGKDLGAEIDLVGPGAAYERWKATPAYRQWLIESGQQQKPLAGAAPTPAK